MLLAITLILQLQVISSFIPSTPHHLTTTTPSSLTTTKRFSSEDENSSSSSSSNDNKSDKDAKIRFLGKGKHAVVRPGVVLVAPIDEYQHYLMKSAIFIHAIGVDEYGEHVTRGVIIDHPTPFTMGEMGGGSIQGVLAHNLLFRGGESGRDSAMLLHSCGEIVDNSDEMIGTSGIYEGGVQDAMDAADSGEVDPDSFKFFFNYMEFTDAELDHMLKSAGEEGDVWASVEVPPSVILNSDIDRGDVWSNLRNQIQQVTKE